MTLKIKAGKYYRTRDGRKVGPMIEETPRWSDWPWEVWNGEAAFGRILWKDDGTASKTQDADIIAEWPDHIIIHEGREYDLTALETAFGFLPDPVRDALKTWPHGVEMMTYSGKIIEYNFPDMMEKCGAVWCAKPAPVEVRVDCMREYERCPGGHATREYGTCGLGPDGKPDWDTWEPL